MSANGARNPRGPRTPSPSYRGPGGLRAAGPGSRRSLRLLGEGDQALGLPLLRGHGDVERAIGGLGGQVRAHRARDVERGLVDLEAVRLELRLEEGEHLVDR